jgi:hypothetical protein
MIDLVTTIDVEPIAVCDVQVHVREKMDVFKGNHLNSVSLPILDDRWIPPTRCREVGVEARDEIAPPGGVTNRK